MVFGWYWYLTPIILLWIVLEMGIRISNEMKVGPQCCVVIFLCVREECYLMLWWGDFHKWSSIFPDLIFAQFVKLFGDYFSTISISFTYSVFMYCFFKSGGTIYKFHLLQKCMKLNKWFIPFFRSFCLNWWKTEKLVQIP